MVPNTQMQLQEEFKHFGDNFWSKDKSGMTRLLDYIKSTHDDLETIYLIYKQRSQLELEFGQKLLSISPKGRDIDDKDKEEFIENDTRVSATYMAVATELKKTAESHIELSKNLREKVMTSFELKLDECKSIYEEWEIKLNELYSERQSKTTELLKVRTKYLKEYEHSKGRSTLVIEELKEEYKNLVEEVGGLCQNWNLEWRKACEAMEDIENDRVNLLFVNVWEYANTVSGGLPIQDEWCEIIRKKLLDFRAEAEIENCIAEFGTSSEIPTVNDYVTELRDAKKKQRPVSSHETVNTPSEQPSSRRSSNIPTQNRQQNQDTWNSRTAQSNMRSLKESQPYQQDSNDGQSDFDRDQYTYDREKTAQLGNNVTNYTEGTVSRGQVKRKPLSKPPMEQLANETTTPTKSSHHRLEDNYSALSSVRSARSPVSNSGEPLQSLVKSFDTVDISSSNNPKESKPKRQPSEYKPDTGSIGPRRGTTSKNVQNHTLQEVSNPTSNPPSNNMQPPSAYSASSAPKSPRPQSQTISHMNSSISGQASPMMTNQAPPTNQYHYMGPPSPMMLPQHSSMMQPPHSLMMPPQHSPMMQPQHSPMMQPQRSPMMQPQHSPMMQPQRSPMMQPQRSPMMQPQGGRPVSPMMQHNMAPQYGSQRGSLPPPSPIPHYGASPQLSPSMSYVTIPNYGTSPQPSPSMSYVTVSPGGALPGPMASSPRTDGMPTHNWAGTNNDYNRRG